MRFPLQPSWPIRTLPCFAFLLCQACRDANLLCPDETASARPDDAATQEASVGAYDLGESHLMMDLARQLRGFAGLYYEPSGDRLVIAMTESTAARFPEVRQLVSAKLTATGISPPLEYVEKVVEFSFIDLARHRAHLRPRLFAIPGAGTLEVDEVSNRIKIGLSDASAKMAVLDLATELAVPIDMIVFSKTHPIRFMDRSADDSYAHALDTDDPTLQDAVSIPDSTLRGGYQVHGNSRSNGQCTLGFVARRIVTSEPGDTLVDDETNRDVPWNT